MSFQFSSNSPNPDQLNSSSSSGTASIDPELQEFLNTMLDDCENFAEYHIIQPDEEKDLVPPASQDQSNTHLQQRVIESKPSQEESVLDTNSPNQDQTNVNLQQDAIEHPNPTEVPKDIVPKAKKVRVHRNHEANVVKDQMDQDTDLPFALTPTTCKNKPDQTPNQNQEKTECDSGYFRCLGTFPSKQEYNEFRKKKEVYNHLEAKIQYGEEEGKVIALLHFTSRTRNSTLGTTHLCTFCSTEWKWNELLKKYKIIEEDYGENCGKNLKPIEPLRRNVTNRNGQGQSNFYLIFSNKFSSSEEI